MVIGVNQAGVDRPAAESKDSAKYGTGNEEKFTNLSNRGNVNNNGTIDEIAWDVMVQK